MTDPMDFQKLIQEAAAAMRLDPARLKEAFRAQAGYGEKFSQLALSAAEKSAELSAKHTHEMLALLGQMTSAKAAPADYGKAMQDFAGSQSRLMQEQMTAFAQILRDVQTQTVELMIEAAQSAQEQGTAAMKPKGSGKS